VIIAGMFIALYVLPGGMRARLTKKRGLVYDTGMKVKLSEKQELILRFILNFIQVHNFPPTVREIAAEFNISVKAAHDHLCVLKKKKRIKMKDKCPRSIELVDMDDGFRLDTCVNIPILGAVAAGKRILAEEVYDGYIPIHSSLLKRRREYFALKVQGDSMTGIGIMNEDIVIIEKKETASNGDVVVIDMDDGRTLKRFYRESSRIKLLSENPAYPPMYSTEVRILGLLAGVYRVCY